MEHHREAICVGGRPPGSPQWEAPIADFTDVDATPDPARLLASLAQSADGLAGMKHYIAATHRRRRSPRPVLDLGCGAGHDLLVLDEVGVDGIGVDPSAVMLHAASLRTLAPLVRAVGNHLPFRDGVFGGAWIERVLMHVTDPQGILAEAVRCIEPGGVVTVFEPAWSSLTVNGVPVPPEWLSPVRHPRIGIDAGALLSAIGCGVQDRVEERSWWSPETFERLVLRSVERAVASGRARHEDVERWIGDVRHSMAQGAFRSEIVKVLWVATTPT